MTPAACGALAISKAINGLACEDRGRLLSVLIRKFGDFNLAEDALQDAMISAGVHWGRTGIPSSPQGWLQTVATRVSQSRSP